MKKDNKIKIVKVPLKTKSKDVFPNFPPMPVLYLELLENFIVTGVLAFL